MPAMDYAQVAGLYDVYAQWEVDVPFFLQECRACRNVLELTSGTGRLSLPLLEAGVNLTCLDSSPEMLAILRRKLQARGLSAPLYEMDICNFALPEKFDLIIIPFHAFAEISEPQAQQQALAAIRAHLAQGGRFICTLGNPAIRLKKCDGQVYTRGVFPLPEEQGTLVLASMETYDPATRLVRGAQFYEIYAPDGLMRSKRLVKIQFFVHSYETFERLYRSQGYEKVALYGDYQHGTYDPENSAYMLWVLKLVHRTPWNNEH